MYIGTAIANSEYGSWLGVMIAANATMIDRGAAAPRAQLLRGEHAGDQQEHQDHRELERQPERDDHQRDEREVLVGGEQRLEVGAADVEQEVQRRLEREQRDDRRPARTGRSTRATNGTAYFFSFGLRPGVMKRHSCQSHTGSASTMPP